MDPDLKADVLDVMRERGEFHVDRQDTHMSYLNFDLDLDSLVVLLVLPRMSGWRVPETRNYGSMSHQISVESVAEAYENADRPREIAAVSLDWGTWQSIWTRDGVESNASGRGWMRGCDL
jgi:hypothetical protein